MLHTITKAADNSEIVVASAAAVCPPRGTRWRALFEEITSSPSPVLSASDTCGRRPAGGGGWRALSGGESAHAGVGRAIIKRSRIINFPLIYTRRYRRTCATRGVQTSSEAELTANLMLSAMKTFAEE